MVQAAGTEHRSAKEVRALLLVKAESLSLPIDEDEIRVTGTEGDLRAVVRYEADLHIPILDRSVYRIGFNHDLTYRR